MMTSNALSVPIGWVAVAVGTTQLIGLVFLIVFFMIGQPFGTLKDICIGLAGLLSGVLAGLLFALLLALAAAGLGALIVAVGSVLVIFRVTGWFLAGFYTEFGNAFIGLWLLALLAWAKPGLAWPRGL